MNLLDPIRLNSLTLKNRIVMAPLTRNRSGKDRVPKEINNIYYTQRSSAGLIISEATVISERAVGYIDTPGIYNEDQIHGWKRITRSVHKYQGVIFCQLWHCGRSSHPDFHNGELPLAPSAIKPNGLVLTYEGKKKKVSPKEMTKAEIKSTIADYVQAAKNSIEAGFDGVEIHGANGYLIDEFICDGSNTRTDEYGSSLDNRLRFPIEVVEAIGNAIGFDKTAIRLSPSGTFNDMYDSDAKNTFATLIEQLNDYDLAYLHLTRHYNPVGSNYPLPNHYLDTDELLPFFRNIYNGTLIGCTGFDKESAEKAIINEEVDMVAFGKLFISNPDLPKRFVENLELNPWDADTFYGGNEKGYIDYPFA